MTALGLFFLLALSVTLQYEFNLVAAQTYNSKFCYDDYTPNTTYEANLNALLSSISDNTSGNNARFYNTSEGRPPNKIYGIFQCRGDIGEELCRKCAKTAAKDIKFRCANKKETVIWYDECWMRYSNKLIISVMIGDPKQYFNYSGPAVNPNLFRMKLNSLMDGLVDTAVSNASNMFATGEEHIGNNQTVYGLLQCTQDISSRECERCLKKSLHQITPCCDSRNGGRILKPSCILWFETYRFFQSTPSTSTATGTNLKLSSNVILIIVVSSVIVMLCVSFILFYCLRRKKGSEIAAYADEIPTVESLQFNFGILVAATDNFSDANKLGEGGFGVVYKGTLLDGRDVAVKRLSKNSGQGVDEFINEVLLLAKLQHRNLVKLLGFCLEENEKLLVYEYVPNASLDHFISDPIKHTILDWVTRYKIIGGIARGLLYLHEDSPDKIIHRDLKTSNILLDDEMNPKISDFGMARLYPIDQSKGVTSRVVGTYGYMAPEYVMEGHFSVKSDVFSFGVLVLEIITGRMNSSFHHEESDVDLLTYVWRKWEEGAALDLLDPTLGDAYIRNEVTKCIQMGLLCVQEDVARRPTMAAVVLILNSDSLTLPAPSAPGFFQSTDEPCLVDQSMNNSIDELSITELDPR